MPKRSTRRSRSLCVIAGAAAAIVALAAPRAPAQAEAEPSPPGELKITALADIYADLVLAEMQEGEGVSPRIAALGPAIDVAESFFRLSAEDMLKSPALTDGSRDLLPSSPGRQRLARLVELRDAHWSDQIVDARFAGESLATLLILYMERPSQKSKLIVTVDLVRRHDVWQVTLDLDADARLPLGDRAEGAVAALRAAVDRRTAELAGVIAAPLDKPLPFHGTWSTHVEQSFVYVSFDSSGEAFILQTREGVHSRDVYDFHLTDDEVVIEARGIPIRLKRLSDGNYWEQDGNRYYCLEIEDPRCWFPECKGPLLLTPAYKGDWPVRRPLAPAE